MTQQELKSLLGSVAAIGVAAGLGWAGSQGGIRVAGVPLFAGAIGVAFLLQWLAFVPSYVWKTERFYDLVGSLSYLSIALLALALAGRMDGRSVLLTALVVLWAVRLGSFLFLRVLRKGKDDRFEGIKTSFFRYLGAWTVQGLWISFTLAAALAAITSRQTVPLGPWAWMGLSVWLIGFGIEGVADAQKRRFRGDPENEGSFIRTGLWAWSRHPNYFGEIVLWVGIAAISAPALGGWQWVGMASPVFVTLLLTRISGVPILERRADETWGGQPEYEAYKERTPVLIPRLPRRTGVQDG